MSKEVIPLEDVTKVLTDFTDKDFERAIILLLLSGMKFKFIRNLKIDDLLNSCKSYFEEEPFTLKDLLNKDPVAENMIAFWDLSTKNHRFICTGPQSLFFIFQHLQRRLVMGGLQVDQTDDYLLVNTAFTQLTNNYVSNWLNPKKLNDKGLNSDIKATNLNNTFYLICEKHLPDDLYKNFTICLFKGKYMSKLAKPYVNMILEDNTILINKYKENLLEPLTLDLDYDLFTSNDDTTDVPSNNTTNECSNSKSTNKTYSNDEILFIIKDYYKNHVQKGRIEDYDEYDYIINHVYRAATFRNSSEYCSFYPNLDIPNLFLNAQIDLLFKDYHIEIEFKSSDNSDEIFKEVMKAIYASGVCSIISIGDRFKDVFFTRLFSYHPYEWEYGEAIIITSFDIAGALCDY